MADPLFGNFDLELIDQARRIRNIETAVDAVAPRLNEVASSMMAENFERQRAGDGPKWKRLSKTTLERRRKGRRRSGSAKILIDTGRMFGARQARTANGQTVIGNAVEYAGVHQTGVDTIVEQNVPSGTIKGHRVKGHRVKAHQVKAHRRRSRQGRMFNVRSYRVKAHTVKSHRVGSYERGAYRRTVRLKIPARPQDWTAEAVDRMLGFVMDYQMEGGTA
jgi:phage gpG-like protein